MSFILCLLVFVQSEWWNFSYRDFILDKVENSKQNPIISLFTNGNEEPIADDFVSFANSSPNFTFTIINCRDTDFCDRNSVTIPSIRVIRGENSRYWRVCEMASLDACLSFELHPGATESSIQPHNDLDETSFHLSLRNVSKMALKMFKEAANYYRIFGPKFTFSFDGGEVPIITAQLSSRFIIKRRVRPIEISPFVEQTLFSVHHVFDQQEFMSYSEQKPLIVWVKKADSDVNPIVEFADEQFGEFRFGIMENSVCIAMMNHSCPTLFGYNNVVDCIVTTDSLDNQSFYTSLLNGKSCWGSIKPHYQRKQPRSGLKSWTVTLLTGAVLVFIVYSGFKKGKKVKVA